MIQIPFITILNWCDVESGVCVLGSSRSMRTENTARYLQAPAPIRTRHLVGIDAGISQPSRGDLFWRKQALDKLVQGGDPAEPSLKSHKVPLILCS